MTVLTEAALVEAMARAMSKPLGNMYGGCFKPEGRDQRDDCADGNCYCARVGQHCARAALAAIREAGAAVVPVEPPAGIYADDLLTWREWLRLLAGAAQEDQR